MRDRDVLGAWAFRVVASGFLALILWVLKGYTGDIDELKKEVPVLSNTVAALTDQIKGEQAEIGKLWSRLFDDAMNHSKSSKK